MKLKKFGIETIYIDKDNSTSHFNSVKDSYRIYKELFKFAMVSFSSFIIDYICFAIFVNGFKVYTILANVLARIISAIYNYNINCKYVFENKQNISNILQYIALAVFILIMNSVILTLYISKLCLNPLIAKILTELTLFIVSFLFQKLVIFRKKKE